MIAFTNVFISISIYTVQLHETDAQFDTLFLSTEQFWLWNIAAFGSTEKINYGKKVLDIWFCFAGLILDDCLEMSCLLLVFHKCDSKNNEIHKKPILYECKMWLLIE